MSASVSTRGIDPGESERDQLIGRVALPMITFAKRRWVEITFTVVLSIYLLVLYGRYASVIYRFTYLTGWLLFILIIALGTYNARKKIPSLSPGMGTSEDWLQFHIYAGFLTVVIFAMHIGFHLPRGWFHGILAALYLVVTFSGVIGLILSVILPRRLTTRGSEALLEQTPSIRRSLQEQVEALALKSIPEAQSPIIADFYIRELKDFFDNFQNFWLHLFEVRSPLNILLDKINDLNRYLNNEEREIMDNIAALVHQKDQLDYQYALQVALKRWLFVHIPFTYSLLFFSLVHIVLVYSFSGGAR